MITQKYKFIIYIIIVGIFSFYFTFLILDKIIDEMVNNTDGHSSLRDYDLNNTEVLMINNSVLLRMDQIFSEALINKNETMMFCYGYRNNTMVIISDCIYKPERIISSKDSNILYYIDTKAIMHIHFHPSNICIFSDQDLKYNKTIKALYCFDKGILWYDGTYHLENITI